MSFNWHHYNDLANELINQKQSSIIQEAYYRSAISRSYYSVFNIIKTFLENQGYSIPKKQAHFTVINLLKQDTKLRPMGVTLERFRNKRNDADYDAKNSISNNDAKFWYGESKKLLEDLKKTS